LDKTKAFMKYLMVNNNCPTIVIGLGELFFNHATNLCVQELAHL